MKEWIINKWLNYWTKTTKEQREWDAWYNENVNWLSPSIQQMFAKFKHVIIVDTKKFVNPHEPFAWIPCQDAAQYFWPARELGNNAVWRFERVCWHSGTQDWVVNGIGSEDRIFVATNSDEDATMITLKYT